MILIRLGLKKIRELQIYNGPRFSLILSSWNWFFSTRPCFELAIQMNWRQSCYMLFLYMFCTWKKFPFHSKNSPPKHTVSVGHVYIISNALMILLYMYIVVGTALPHRSVPHTTQIMPVHIAQHIHTHI